jgi:TPR repeat protein
MKIILMMIAFSLMIFADNSKLTAESCIAQANQLRDQIYNGKINKEDGYKLAESLCNDGCGKACYLVVGSYSNPEKGCEVKFPDGRACYDLGTIEFKQKGCEVGYSLGCAFLGDNYAKEKNYGLALKYYNIGCDFGGGGACDTLGLIYATGEYGETDPRKAYEYWSRSVKAKANHTSVLEWSLSELKGNLKILCDKNPSACK